MKKIGFILLTVCLALSQVVEAKDYTVSSPDGKLQVIIHAQSDKLTWELKRGTTIVLMPSEIGLNGALTQMSAKIKGNTAVMKNKNYSVEFRVDNDAAAYRINALTTKPFKVKNETAEFNFADDYQAYIPYTNGIHGNDRWCCSFESYYDEVKLSQIYNDSLIINPLAVRLPDGLLTVITEMDATNYPGMMLLKHGEYGFKAGFAPYPLSEKKGGYANYNWLPVKRADYIAESDGKMVMPWRIVMVVENDYELLNAGLTKRFGTECRIKNTSWIKYGKVAWDWWNATLLTGVDFKSGMNTETYKYYIDFAHLNDIEYVIIDDGWSTNESLRENLNQAIDLKEVISYADKCGVGIILWTTWSNCIATYKEDFKYYASLGVKGFKVDFFDRDDQKAVQSVWQIAECAAENHLILDLHGFHPNGIHSAFPNVMNIEGVKGLENAKWEGRNNNGPLHDQPHYDLLIPYLRMLTGPMDYTPGAMQNATKENFIGSYHNPMSQGTRSHQVAMYVLYDAPLQMLSDSPSRYIKEKETTNFIKKIPTVYDSVLPLDGKIGEFLVVAKRKGNTWYIAAMNDWTPRDLSIKLDMLTDGLHNAEIFSDGMNADRCATDYKIQNTTVSSKNVLQIHLAPGGGWCAVIE